MPKKIQWTDEMIKYLIEHYPNDTADDIADALGLSDTTVSFKAKSIGLQKSSDFQKRNFYGRYVRKAGVIRHNL